MKRDAIKKVLGKRIVKVEPRRFYSGHGAAQKWAYDPVFILEDGTEIVFVAQETEVGEYGVEALVRTRRKDRIK